ncbi:hypothetical protein P9112_005889 [Eukaryota sp. TZLM1-RC]
MTHLPPNVHLYPHAECPSTMGDVNTFSKPSSVPVDPLQCCQWTVLTLIFTVVVIVSIAWRAGYPTNSTLFLDSLFFIHLLIITASTFYSFYRLPSVNFEKQRFFGTVLLFVSWFICSILPIVPTFFSMRVIVRPLYVFLDLFFILISFIIPFVALKLVLRKASETDLILGLTYGSIFGFTLANRWQIPFELFAIYHFHGYLISYDRYDYRIHENVPAALVFFLLSLFSLAALIVMGMAFGLAVVIKRRKIGTRKHYINLFLFSIIPSCLLCYVVDEVHMYVLALNAARSPNNYDDDPYFPTVDWGYYLTSYFVIIVSCVYCYFMGMKLKLLMHKFQNEVEESITTNPMTTAKV